MSSKAKFEWKRLLIEAIKKLVYLKYRSGMRSITTMAASHHFRVFLPVALFIASVSHHEVSIVAGSRAIYHPFALYAIKRLKTITYDIITVRFQLRMEIKNAKKTTKRIQNLIVENCKLESCFVNSSTNAL